MLLNCSAGHTIDTEEHEFLPGHSLCKKPGDKCGTQISADNLAGPTYCGCRVEETRFLYERIPNPNLDEEALSIIVKYTVLKVTRNMLLMRNGRKIRRLRSRTDLDGITRETVIFSSIESLKETLIKRARFKLENHKSAIKRQKEFIKTIEEIK